MSDPDTSSRTLPPHEIVVILPGHQGRELLLDQCISVRIEVFVHEQRFSVDVEVDEHDPTATHMLLRLVPSLTPIGTIRTYKLEGTNHDYKLSRLAVIKPYRKFHFGRDLVLSLHQWVKDDAMRNGLQVAQVVCHSQLPAKGFYAKYGYQPEGGEFDEDGAPHQKMVAYLLSL